MTRSFEEQLAVVARKVHKVSFDDDFERYKSGLLYYWNKAEPLNNAAKRVWDGLLLGPIAIMLTGMSMELLLKGIYIAFDKKVPRHHIIDELCNGLGIELNSKDRNLLKIISEHVIWTARYTTPTDAKKMFDATQLFDQRKVTREDCDRLWEMIATYYHRAQEARPESVTLFEEE